MIHSVGRPSYSDSVPNSPLRKLPERPVAPLPIDALSAIEFRDHCYPFSRHGVKKMTQQCLTKREGDSGDEEEGTVYWRDGDWWHGRLRRGEPIAVDYKEVSSALFMKLTLGISHNFCFIMYPLSLITDFLFENGYREEGESFRGAQKLLMMSLEDPQIAAEEIDEKIRQGQSQIIPYLAQSHAMMLKIRPYEEYIDFEVYNSGQGLGFYHQRKECNKFETKVIVTIPAQNLCKRELCSFLSEWNSQSVKKAYQKLFELPGAKRTFVEWPQKVFQRPQKANNCTIESCFALLRHSLGYFPYNEMRLKLFEKFRSAAPIAFCEEPELRRKVEAILDAKIAKRKQRLINLAQV